MEGECREEEVPGRRGYGCSRSQRVQRPRDQHIPRVPGTRQREGARPGLEEGGAWPRAGGGRWRRGCRTPLVARGLGFAAHGAFGREL